MSEKKSKFIREYVRQSKSIFDDKSTNLILCDYQISKEGEVELDFQNDYIYYHRDSCGRIVGLSMSKAIADEQEMESRYLSGTDMALILLIYKDKISNFCQLFEDEFVLLFGLKPTIYFDVAELQWLETVENI